MGVRAEGRYLSLGGWASWWIVDVNMSFYWNLVVCEEVPGIQSQAVLFTVFAER